MLFNVYRQQLNCSKNIKNCCLFQYFLCWHIFSYCMLIGNLFCNVHQFCLKQRCYPETTNIYTYIFYCKVTYKFILHDQPAGHTYVKCKWLVQIASPSSFMDRQTSPLCYAGINNDLYDNGYTPYKDPFFEKDQIILCQMEYENKLWTLKESEICNTKTDGNSLFRHHIIFHIFWLIGLRSRVLQIRYL